MAKQMKMTIRIKNLTEHTVAVANSILSPKATVPIMVRKAAHIESILLNVKQGKVELVKADTTTLAAMIGFDLGLDEEDKAIEQESDAASKDEAPKDEEANDAAPKDEVPKDVAPKDEAPKDEEKKDVAPKKPAPKSSNKKKPAPKPEEDDQQTLLDEKE